MSAPICPYCGDGMESIGTLNHIECATKLMAEVKRLRHEFEEMTKLHDEQFKAKNAAEAEVERLKNAVMAGTEQWLREQQRAEVLEAENEALKCCGNCKHLVTDTVQTRTIRILAQVVLPRACTLQCGECDSDVTAWGRCMFTPSRWQRRQP